MEFWLFTPRMSYSNCLVVTWSGHNNLFLTMSRNETYSVCIRFWGGLLSLNKVKQTNAALFTSEAMLVCILVTQACTDLCKFTSHIDSTSSNQPHWTSNQPRGQRGSFPPSLLWPFLPLSTSVSLSLCVSVSLCLSLSISIISIFISVSPLFPLYSLCRTYWILMLLVSGSFTWSSRVLVLTLQEKQVIGKWQGCLAGDT